MRKTTAHLDPAAILVTNARILAAASSRPESYRGPQMTDHRKPNAGGVACDICGCLGIRLGVMHRALGFGETGARSRFEITAKDYSGDVAVRTVDYDGKGC